MALLPSTDNAEGKATLVRQLVLLDLRARSRMTTTPSVCKYRSEVNVETRSCLASWQGSLWSREGDSFVHALLSRGQVCLSETLL